MQVVLPLGQAQHLASVSVLQARRVQGTQRVHVEGMKGILSWPVS